ncbi:LacI family DNA-binding transcriptional regulator [Pseudovibrio exalbescens]|uniref:LacI family DNA-binding transcriptional regulator n=1 Tax=Pseudovibrio exalbescens TaxID=197461 RepID=UPI002365ED74|nr:LacI family DNA-binding transcriptional regulator [Pseudovibrio exalbescens]MDD7911465.1 LacI family DNA-binding transcriptional regulator [Pseudovibrio exalbescens]
MKKNADLSPGSITLVDVAKEAGVSAITVSRTIRSPEIVSEASRKKVEAAIAKLGYAPDPAASALASKTTSTIGLLVPSLTNNVFADVVRGVYDGIEGTRYFVQIGNFRYSALKEEDLLRVFLRQKPAGLIVSGFDQTAQACDLLRTAPCPVVQIMDFGPEPADMAIGFEHRDAARAATQHLLDSGYKKPGFLGARMDPRSQARLEGFKDVCRAAEIMDEARIVTTRQPSNVGMGRQLFELLLSRAPDTDAVFCNNDDLAIGVLMEAQRRNITVPTDFGVCGFNDIEIARNMVPEMTSVSTPRYDIGRRAIQMILDEIKSPGSVEDRNCNLGFELIERSSTLRRS